MTEHNPFDLGTPSVPGYKITNTNAMTTQNTMEELKKELAKKLSDRFDENTTIGENRYAENFLKEDVNPALLSAYALGIKKSMEVVEEKGRQFPMQQIDGDVRVYTKGRRDILSELTGVLTALLDNEK